MALVYYLDLHFTRLESIMRPMIKSWEDICLSYSTLDPCLWRTEVHGWASLPVLQVCTTTAKLTDLMLCRKHMHLPFFLLLVLSELGELRKSLVTFPSSTTIVHKNFSHRVLNPSGQNFQVTLTSILPSRVSVILDKILLSQGHPFSLVMQSLLLF